VYLDAINSLLISGEVPHLFTNDEMEGLLQVILKKTKRNKTFSLLLYHFKICLSTIHPLEIKLPYDHDGPTV